MLNTLTAVFHSGIDIYLKSLVILALALLVSWTMRRKSAAVRSVMWSVTFAALALLPLFTVITPKTEVAAWPTTAPRASVSIRTTLHLVLPVHQPMSTILLTPVSPLIPTAVSDSQNSNPHPRSSIHADYLAIAQSATVIVWVLGALSLLLRAAFRVSALRNLLNDSTPRPEWKTLLPRMAERRIRFVEGGPQTAGLSPMTWGFIRPIVLLPLGSASWSDEHRRLALLHEVAHAARFDWPIQLAVDLVRCMYWINPLCAVGLRAHVAASEQACDDCVVLSGAQPAEYASVLLETVKNLRSTGFPGAIAMASPGRLGVRIQTILRTGANRGAASPMLLLAIVVVVAGTVLTVAALTHKPKTLDSIVAVSGANGESPNFAQNIARLRNGLAKFGESDPAAASAHFVLAQNEAAANLNSDALRDYSLAASLPERAIDRQERIGPQSMVSHISVLSSMGKYGEALAESKALAAKGLPEYPQSTARQDMDTYSHIISNRKDGGLSYALAEYRTYQLAKAMGHGAILQQNNLTSLAEELSMSGQKAKADEVFAYALGRYSGSGDAFKIELVRAQMAGLPDLKVIKSIVNRYPAHASDPELLYDLGLAYDSENKLNDATEQYHKAFEASDQEVSAVAGRAYIINLARSGKDAERNVALAELSRRFPMSGETKELQLSDDPAELSRHFDFVVNAGDNIPKIGDTQITLLQVNADHSSTSWLPDGTAIPRNAKDRNEMHDPMPAASFGILYRLTGPASPQHAPQVFVNAFRRGVAGAEMAVVSDSTNGETTTRDIWYGQTVTSNLPPSVDLTITVEGQKWTRVARWTTVATNSNRLTFSNGELRLESVGYNSLPPKPNLWTLKDTYPGGKRRVTVRYANRKSLVVESHESGTSGNETTSWFEMPVKSPGSIEAITIDVEPYTWVKVRGVRLRPNADRMASR